MIFGKNLFVDRSLSDYLDQQVASLRPHIDKTITSTQSSFDNDAWIAKILKQAIVEPLILSAEPINKRVVPAKIAVRQFGEDHLVDGVLAERTYQFTGERELFFLKPSTFNFAPPRGEVSGNTVVVGIKDTLDQDHIKGQLDQQRESLGQYIEWQRCEIERHNNSLGGRIKTLVAERCAFLQGIAQLKAAI
jgi:hypothetical protein